MTSSDHIDTSCVRRSEHGVLQLIFEEPGLPADKTRFNAELAEARRQSELYGEDVRWIHNGVEMDPSDPHCSWEQYTERHGEMAN